MLWPKCSKDGCGWPGIVKFETEDEGGPITAFLCPLCVAQAPALLREMAAARKERHLLARESDGEET